MAKSALERLSQEKKSKTVVLEKDFAGVRKGQKLFVATPRIVDDYLKNIPFGEVRTIPQMRGELAQSRDCDATCPVSTAIFIRISAQAAIEELEMGKSVEQVTPFWRLLTSGDKIAKKLTVSGDWIDEQRRLEES